MTSIETGAFSDCSLDSIKVLNPTPPACHERAFTWYYSLLEVPEGALDAYISHDVWSLFADIVEFSVNVTGIKDVEKNVEGFHELARYDINGRLLSKPAPGINIIKMSDGSTRKEVIKR